jgi:hypothetical protein
MYPYPTQINGSEGIMGFLEYVNLVTDGWVSNMILLTLYIIVLYGFYKVNGDFAGGMAVSGFFVFIIALLFWLGNFLSTITFSIVIAMTILGVLVLLLNRN